MKFKRAVAALLAVLICLGVLPLGAFHGLVAHAASNDVPTAQDENGAYYTVEKVDGDFSALTGSPLDLYKVAVQEDTSSLTVDYSGISDCGRNGMPGCIICVSPHPLETLDDHTVRFAIDGTGCGNEYLEVMIPGNYDNTYDNLLFFVGDNMMNAGFLLLVQIGGAEAPAPVPTVQDAGGQTYAVEHVEGDFSGLTGVTPTDLYKVAVPEGFSPLTVDFGGVADSWTGSQLAFDYFNCHTITVGENCTATIPTAESGDNNQLRSLTSTNLPGIIDTAYENILFVFTTDSFSGAFLLLVQIGGGGGGAETPTVTAGSSTRNGSSSATVTFTATANGKYAYAVYEEQQQNPVEPSDGWTEFTQGETTLTLADLTGTGAKYVYIWAKDSSGAAMAGSPLMMVVPEYVAPDFTLNIVIDATNLPLHSKNGVSVNGERVADSNGNKNQFTISVSPGDTVLIDVVLEDGTKKFGNLAFSSRQEPISSVPITVLDDGKFSFTVPEGWEDLVDTVFSQSLSVAVNGTLQDAETPQYLLTGTATTAGSAGGALGTVTFQYAGGDATTVAKEGDSITAVAAPATSGGAYDPQFAGWSSEDIEIPEDARENPELTFSMPGKEVTLTANYTLQGTTVTVSHASQGGSPQVRVGSVTLTPENAGSTIANVMKTGAQATATATCPNGYDLTGWTITSDGEPVTYVSGNEGNATFTVTGNTMTVTPNFTARTAANVSVKANDSAYGTASLSVGVQSGTNFVVAAGTSITLTATANRGYLFQEWQIAYADGHEADGDLEIENPTQVTTSFTMPTTTRDILITAVFVEDPDAAKSGEKEITLVQLLDADQTVLATADRTGLAYTLTLPASISAETVQAIPTGISGLYLKVVASDKATVKQNGNYGQYDDATGTNGSWSSGNIVCWMPINEPITFTVTAEDSTTQDYTITLLYTPSSSVTVTFAGGEGATANEGAVTTISGNAGGIITLPSPMFTREGYLFVGWGDYPAGAQYTLPSENVTLTATWTAMESATVEDVAQSVGGISPETAGEYKSLIQDAAKALAQTEISDTNALENRDVIEQVADLYAAIGSARVTITGDASEGVSESGAILVSDGIQHVMLRINEVGAGDAALKDLPAVYQGDHYVAAYRDISLFVGDDAKSTPDVPVIITVPIPAEFAGFDSSTIRVLHYKGGNTEPTILTPVVGNSTITFAMDSFSHVYFVCERTASSVGEYTITINAPAAGGTIVPSKTTANAGEMITLSVVPNTGYQMVAGSLTYTQNVAGSSPVAISNFQFTMPAADVTVTCQWETATTVSGGITSFIINGVSGVINQTTGTITVTLPYGTSVNRLVPVIATANVVSLSPSSGTSVNFNRPVTYTAWLTDGTIKTYVVTVYVQAGSTADNMWEDLIDFYDQIPWWEYAERQQSRGRYPRYWD